MYRNAKRAVRAKSLVSTISRTSLLFAASLYALGCADDSVMLTSDVLDATVDPQPESLDASVSWAANPADAAATRSGPSRFTSGGEAGIGELMAPAIVFADAGTAVAPDTQARDAAGALAPSVDAGSDASTSVTEAAVQPPVVEACDPTGTWAFKLQGNVTSPSTQYSDSGGQTRLWLLIDVDGADGAFAGDTHLCGLDFPAIKLKPEFGGESYQIQFSRSTSTYRPEGLPSGKVRLRASADKVALDPLAILLGVKLDNAPGTAWPDDGTSVAFDADQDGAAGITTSWSTSNGQLLPPVDLTASERAQRTLLTGRVVLGASEFTGCDKLAGSSGAARIDTHVIGCTLADGNPCSSSQVSILETIKPDYAAAQSNLEAVRLPAGSRCAEVLKALP